MSHPIHFPTETKLKLSNAINERLQGVRISRLGNEPNYTAALIQALDGFKYEDEHCKFMIEGVVVDQYTTEKWAGADFTVHTTLTQPRSSAVQKATLIQSKLGRVAPLSESRLAEALRKIGVVAKEKLSPTERLLKQIQDMTKLTPHPKVLEVSRTDGEVPTVVSAVGYLECRRLQHQPFGAWIARRVLPTFDGNTDPRFTNAVLETNLSKLIVYGAKKGR